MHIFIRVGALVLAILFTTKNYGNGPFQVANHSKLKLYSSEWGLDKVGSYKLGFVEFDDEGKIFTDGNGKNGNIDPTAKTSMDLLLDDIKATARIKNTLVLVYAHGWHHNAKDDDTDLMSFKLTLAELDYLLNAGKFRKSRRESALANGSNSYDDSEQVIGIYLGWRGRSAPWLLDYATFWGRKPAARRIGTGEAADFLVRVNRIYRELNEESRVKAPFRFTGLVVAGHSFGGALVLSAVEAQFQTLLASNVDGPSRDQKAIQKCPLKEEENGLPRFPLFNGLGDLVILVNPAIESAVYEPIWALSANKQYSACQSPIMMTVSAENDSARKTWFRAAQALSVVSRSTRNHEESQLHQALGDYEGHVTHKVTTVAKNVDDPRCPEDIQGEDDPSVGIHLGAGHRFHGENNVDYCFRPERRSREVSYDNPFIVVRATKDVANGHLSAFQPSLDYFLIRFILVTAEKRQQHFALEHSGGAREAL